jgi:predicted nucleic acid-binding protein
MGLKKLIIIDTDILIDARRNVSEALNCLQQIEQRLPVAVSSVTQMELIIGCRNKNELDSLEQFLTGLI